MDSYLFVWIGICMRFLIRADVIVYRTRLSLILVELPIFSLLESLPFGEHGLNRLCTTDGSFSVPGVFADHIIIYAIHHVLDQAHMVERHIVDLQHVQLPPVAPLGLGPQRLYACCDIGAVGQVPDQLDVDIILGGGFPHNNGLVDTAVVEEHSQFGTSSVYGSDSTQYVHEVLCIEASDAIMAVDPTSCGRDHRAAHDMGQRGIPRFRLDGETGHLPLG